MQLANFYQSLSGMLGTFAAGLLISGAMSDNAIGITAATCCFVGMCLGIHATHILQEAQPEKGE